MAEQSKSQKASGGMTDAELAALDAEIQAQLDAEEAARQKAIALVVAEQQRADRESRQAVLADAEGWLVALMEREGAVLFDVTMAAEDLREAGVPVKIAGLD